MDRVVVADTSPLRYLVVIEQIGLLPQLFGQIAVPSVVFDELRHPSAPPAARDWINSAPKWLEVLPVTSLPDPAFDSLDQGERDAHTLGLSLAAKLILIDERKGAAVARQKGFAIMGTLGIPGLAARRDIIDLADAFTSLKRTNFRRSEALFDAMLNEHRREKGVV